MLIDNKQENLSSLFRKLMLEYADMYTHVSTTKDWKNTFKELVSKDIPKAISKRLNLTDPYIVEGSAGKGLWTKVPWVAVFDTRITRSAQHDVYIVYLLNKDTKELFLVLGCAATESLRTTSSTDSEQSPFVGVAGHISKTVKNDLAFRVKQIREKLDSKLFLSDDKVNTGSEAYDGGTIYYKRYTLDSLPNDDQLAIDLKNMLELYGKYYELYINKQSNTNYDFLPSLSSYDPHITADQWLTLLIDDSVFDEKCLLAMACIYDNGGMGSCTELAKKYHQSMVLWRTNCGYHLAKRVIERLQCPVMKDEKGNTIYFTIPFLYRKSSGDEDGVYTYKLRPELYEALTAFDILRFLPKNTPQIPEITLSTKEILEKAKEYIASKGFSYTDKLIENFYLSLKSKPFVILAGTSGTGKTRLVKLFAEAIGAEYRLVPVRPDWSDGSDLFGHYDLNGKFIKGPVCDAFDTAYEYPDKPVFLCLDEMNLARVEYYLSDFLSVIESREKEEDGKIITSAIAQYDDGIPDNLYIIGTVNMDETTFPFSKKVLDRANTIEFNFVDLTPDFDQVQPGTESLNVNNSVLHTDYLVLARDCGDEKEYVCKICDKLLKLNSILQKANAHVGYRVRDEIVFYMLNNKKAGNLLKEDEAFDNEIMQKILPRIQGSSAGIKDMLTELYKFCMKNISGLDEEKQNIGKQMIDNAPSAVYPVSAAKIGYMMTRYEEDGFTSYWL